MLKTLESLVGSVLVLGALLLFLAGMVSRFFSLGLGGGWIAEVTVYLIAWGLLLSAAGCVAEQSHVRADFFLRMAGEGFRRIADILAAAAGLAFCLALGWFGWQVVEFALAWDERGPSYLQIPKAWFYAALPVSMALCSLRYLLELIALLRGRHPPQAHEA
jgi:TRAP-type C4-dicarboxylate transport system permease small subunit